MNHPSSAKFSALIASTALLAACGGTATGNNAADANVAVANTQAAAAPEANVAAPAVPVAAPADGVPTADFMVGKWSASDEDCAQTLEFRKDGSVATPIGDAKWSLAKDQLAVDFGDGGKTDPTTVKVLSQDRIEITMGSGKKEMQKRC